MNNFEFLVGETVVSATGEIRPEGVFMKIGADDYRLIAINENLLKVTCNGRSYIVAAVKYKDVIYIDIDSHVIEVRAGDSVSNSAAASAHNVVKDKVFAPMPGKIVKIMVSTGDTVAEKQPLAIVEAMKMENQINSPAAGRVKSINFGAGAQVNTTTPIIELDLDA